MVTGSEISDFFSAAESGRGCWCAAGEWSSNYFECFCQQQIEECSHSPFSCQSFGHHNLLLVLRNWEQLHHWPVLDPQADFHLFLCSKWTRKNLVCSCGDTTGVLRGTGKLLEWVKCSVFVPKWGSSKMSKSVCGEFLSMLSQHDFNRRYRKKPFSFKALLIPRSFGWRAPFQVNVLWRCSKRVEYSLLLWLE